MGFPVINVESVTFRWIILQRGFNLSNWFWNPSRVCHGMFLFSRAPQLYMLWKGTSFWGGFKLWLDNFNKDLIVLLLGKLLNSNFILHTIHGFITPYHIISFFFLMLRRLSSLTPPSMKGITSLWSPLVPFYLFCCVGTKCIITNIITGCYNIGLLLFLYLHTNNSFFDWVCSRSVMTLVFPGQWHLKPNLPLSLKSVCVFLYKLFGLYWHFIFSLNLLFGFPTALSASSVHLSVMPFGINALLICNQIFAEDFRGNIWG